jgi:hypothetical protein
MFRDYLWAVLLGSSAILFPFMAVLEGLKKPDIPTGSWRLFAELDVGVARLTEGAVAIVDAWRVAVDTDIDVAAGLHHELQTSPLERHAKTDPSMMS